MTNTNQTQIPRGRNSKQTSMNLLKQKGRRTSEHSHCMRLLLESIAAHQLAGCKRVLLSSSRPPAVQFPEHSWAEPGGQDEASK